MITQHKACPGLSTVAFTLLALINMPSWADRLNQSGTWRDTRPPLPPLDAVYPVINDIPVRSQWNANYGYCGEVSMISAGLYYGQYLSQYDMRAIASPGKKQNRVDAQLLLGVNDTMAAKQLRLRYERLAQASDTRFYTWVKHHVTQGHPVLAAVYANAFIFDGNTAPGAGNSEYDHIVSAVGFGSNISLENGYDPGDVMLINDNGLYTDDETTPYFYPLHIASHLASRQTANARRGPIYSLPKSPVIKYGLAITGVMDTYGETLPVTVTTGTPDERPEIRENSNTRPTPKALTLTLRVSGLTPGQEYNLYYYKDQRVVPIEHFNRNSARVGISPWKTFIASSETWSTRLTIPSNEKAFFRAVKRATRS